ncbi:MAG: pyridoxamine 5'-phosphate oxidase [Planctomycetota bacterium]|jgi:pyridoxamine 5'-phosphate oxidase
MDFDHPPADPVPQLHDWLDEAARSTGLPNPNAMALATVDANGIVSTRMVLLKSLDQHGAVFYTNRSSRKGHAIDAHPHVSLLLHWDVLNRQVRIEGRAVPVPDDESDAYFASRPRASQIGAWASDQSQPVDTRAELDSRMAAMEQRFEGQDVPRPPHWGGYRVRLDRLEFWQGHPFRLHDRVIYEPDDRGGWRTQRLCP